MRVWFDRFIDAYVWVLLGIVAIIVAVSLAGAIDFSTKRGLPPCDGSEMSVETYLDPATGKLVDDVVKLHDCDPSLDPGGPGADEPQWGPPGR
jgi:hypothetical protein